MERSNRELEQFAYISSHDMQEPLRQVRAYVQLLRERYADKFDGRAGQFFEFIYEGAERMSNLVSDLLEYSRVGSRERKLELVPCRQVLDAALRNLAASIQEAGATITHDELPALTGDRTQLTQLFQNLIGNAVKFRRDGVPPEIHIGASMENDCRNAWPVSQRVIPPGRQRRAEAPAASAPGGHAGLPLSTGTLRRSRDSTDPRLTLFAVWS